MSVFDTQIVALLYVLEKYNVIKREEIYENVLYLQNVF